MKKVIILFFVFACSTLAFGQKMSKEEMEAKIDTLSKANATLVAKNDTLSNQLVPLQAIYDTLKTHYFKVDFAAKDVKSKMAEYVKQNSTGTDSLLLVNKELKVQLDSVSNSAEARQKEKEQVIRDLEQAKSLMDQGILTEEEFMAIKKKYLPKL